MDRHARIAGIAKRCVAQARAQLGSGWDHVSPALRAGLVDSAVLGVVLSLDEGTRPERVVAMLHELSAATAEILKG